MEQKRFWAAAVILIFTLMFAPGARAQGHYKVLYKFAGAADGGGPSSLVIDAAGNLYGTAVSGGAFDYGTVFKLDATGTFTVLYSFGGGADGGLPTGSVALDPSGNVYGTTTRGGNGLGVLFKLTPNQDGTWSETVLHSFPGYDGDAAEPYGGVAWGPDGNLYGGTWQGGSSWDGTIFKSDTGGNEAVVHSFSYSSEGAHVYKPPIFDPQGNLYATTLWGGSSGYGTVVKLDPAGKLIVLHSFTGGKDGAYLVGGLTLDQAGNLYGTTQLGGAHGDGVVFMGTPRQDGKFQGKILHAFAGHPGAEPISTMVFDAKGNLYGTADGYSEQGHGSIFELTP